MDSTKGIIKATVLWDGGSTLSFITFKKAKELGLNGKPVNLEVTTIGGNVNLIESILYNVTLLDERKNTVTIEILGIDKISTSMNPIDMKTKIQRFKIYSQHYPNCSLVQISAI